MTDSSHSQHSANPGVADEGIPTGPLFVIIGVATLLVTVLVVVAVSVIDLRFQDATLEATEETGYPLLRETRMNGMALLDRYEVVDQDAKIYRIPIDRAMRLVVEESQ